MTRLFIAAFLFAQLLVLLPGTVLGVREQRESITSVRSLLAARAHVTNHLRLGKDCKGSCDVCGKKDACTTKGPNCCWQDKEKDCSGSGDKSCNSKHCEGAACITKAPTPAPTSSPTTVFEKVVLETLENNLDAINTAMQSAIPSKIAIDEGVSGKDSVNWGLCTAKYKYSAKVDDLDNLNTATITSFDSVDSSLASSGSIEIYGTASVSSIKVTGKASASCGTCGLSISESGDASAKIDATGDLSLTCTSTACVTDDNESGYTISDCSSELETDTVKTDIYDEKLSISGIPDSITNAIIGLFSSVALTSAVEEELVDALAPTIDSEINTEVDDLLSSLGCVALN